MGVVYRACQLSLNRPVALKMILERLDGSPAMVARFQLEAEAAAKLNHPNIVPIYEIGEDQGRYFFSMELLEGGSLAERMGEFALSEPAPSKADALARQRRIAQLIAVVAKAVDHAHQRGILHRDLKPANILFDKDMEPHITDFGLAKLLEQESLVTQPGVLLGTPAYVAPEQAQGGQQATTAADVYSLGAILYHLLTGQPPFRAATPVETVRQIIDQEPMPPAQRNPVIDGHLATICLKCLCKDPAGRYNSARAVAEDLDRWVRGEAILAVSQTASERLWRWCKRKPALAGLTGAVFLLLVAVAIILFVAQRQTTEKLWESYLAQARALRSSVRAGRQFESLQAVRNAARIRPSLELRNEAIAALAQTDLRPLSSQEKEEIGFPRNPGPGEKVVLDWPRKQFALAHRDGSIAIQSLGPQATTVHLPGVAAVDSLGDCSSDGHWLLVNYQDRKTRLWDVENAKAEGEFIDPSACGFSPDAKWLMTCQGDNAVQILELSNLKSNRAIAMPGAIHDLRWRPDGQSIACISDKAVFLLNPFSAAAPLKLDLPADPFGMAWRADGGELAIGDVNGAIHLFDTNGGAALGNLTGHLEAVTAVCFNPAGTMLASHGWDGRLRLWEVSTGREILSVPSGVEQISFCDDGRHLLASDLGQTRLEMFEIGLNEVVVNLGNDYQRHPTRGDALLFDASNRWVATSMDEALSLWSPATGDPLARYENQPFSTLLRIESGGVFGWWRGGFYRTSDNPEQMLTAERKFVPVVPASLADQWSHTLSGGGTNGLVPMRGAVSADGRLAAFTILDRCHIFDMRGGTLQAITGAQAGMKFVSVSPDGALVATGGWNSTNVMLWNAADGQKKRELPAGFSPNVAFSPEGRWLVIGTGSEYIFWRTSDWQEDHRFNRPENEGLPGPICFSKDGQLAAVAYTRNSVRLIAPETGATLAEFEPTPERQLIALAFNSDASELALTRTAAPPQVWHLSRIRQRLTALKLDW
jgi:eukaryotic-like serine/threonine-protein kinase